MTAKKKKTAKKTTKRKTTGKIGRPKLQHPKKTISFRIPEEAEEAFAILADKRTKKQAAGLPAVKVSALYTQALAEFLQRQGARIPDEVW